jgi:DNA polymerase-1
VNESRPDTPTLFLLDGHALIYRAFFAMISRPLTTSKGENTSAPFGLSRFLVRILDEYRPDYVGVVLDAGDSYRTELYDDYKATREKMPDELAASMDRCREVVEAFHVPVIEVEGWEADDVIGTLASQASHEGLRTVIVSGDKDFYQLIADDVHLLNPGRRGPGAVEEAEVTPENASVRLGVPPGLVVDYLALIGDSSDNVPGVRGIGPKTAPGLLERFGSLERLLENAEQVERAGVRKALLEHSELAKLSKELVTIRTDVPVELDLDALRRGPPDRARLRELFLELEFHTMAREYAPDEPDSTGDAPGRSSEERTYETVIDPGHLATVLEELRKAGTIAVDTETTSIDPMRAKLVGISLSAEPGKAWYLPFAHVPPASVPDAEGNPSFAFDTAEVPNLPPVTSEAMADLRALLADPDVGKIGHNIKYDMIVLERAGAPLGGVEFDTSLASYVLDPGKRAHSLDVLGLERLKRKLISYSDVCGSGRAQIPFSEVPLDRATEYAAEDADVSLELFTLLKEDLEQHEMLELLHEVEMPLVPVLASMEMRGVGIDGPFFDQLGEKFAGELEQVEDEIRKLAGSEVNLRSVPQLRTLLFETLELPVVKKTKTGPSTDESVLSQLAEDGHQVPRLILEYRELDKLDSTYVRKLPTMVNPDTGRIHTSFNQTVAATGRLSSSDPNLQNIPIRSALGRQIRKGFVPADGHLFVSADYSQIELRVLAHLSGDPAFVEAFQAGGDIHRETAARIFGVAPADVNPAMRDRAKTINFGLIYGQGGSALARQLGISRAEAEEFIQGYFERFSGVRDYLETMKETAREKGYVETLLGRRRYIPEIRSRNPGVRGFGERTATNSPIQGTAADLIKLAMINLHQRLGDGPIRMLLQVHDELLFEVPEDQVGDAIQIVAEEMEGAIELSVPLRVDLGSGDSWYASKGG